MRGGIEMVEFKTYEESRLDAHIQLVLEVSKDWEWMPWYPNQDELKKIYSREGFTPDTRHYAYDGAELVGFLSSAVEEVVDGVQFGSFHIPYIKIELIYPLHIGVVTDLVRQHAAV